MKTLPLLSILSFALMPFPAAAGILDLRVSFDCFLSFGSVQCQPLMDSYFSTFPYLKQVGPEESELKIQIRSSRESNATAYDFSLAGEGRRSEGRIVIPRTISADGALIQLRGELEKATAFFLRLAQPANTENGRTMIVVGAPGEDGDGDKPGGSTSGWYLSLNGSGNFSVGDGRSATAHSSSTLNYSDPSWRFKVSGMVNYQHIQVEYAGQKEEVAVFYAGGSVLLLRSLDENWNVAAVVSLDHNPSANFDLSASAVVGVEWILVPFLKANDEAISVRYVLGGEHHDYVDPNVLDRERMSFLVHQISAQISKHWTKVDLRGNLGAGSNLNDSRFYRVDGSGTLRWQITPRLALSQGLSGRYQSGAISEPRDAESGSGLEEFFSSGNYSNWSFGGDISIEFTIGNAGIFFEDQRW